MIDLAKIEANALMIQPSAFDLLALVREVVEHNAGPIKRKGITVSIEEHDSLPYVMGDHALVRRVCNALLDNTLKFTTEGCQASFRFQQEANRLILSLQDNGRPIAPQYQRAVFERAIQWEARKNGSRTTVAMGLPFARAAMRRMHGDLVASSNPADQTTTFSLHLPLASSQSHE